MWSDDIDLTLTIDGSVVSDAVIAHASWRHGRQDWFAPLSPGTISITLRGDQTGSIAAGDSLVLSRGSDALWTGKVDTVTLSQEPLRTGETLDETMVTGADFVAQLGEARLKEQDVSLDLFHEQLSDVLGFADITATVSLSPSVADDGQLAAWSDYTGTVLDWINTAERYANAIVAVDGAGDILVCTRDRLPDYGERVLNDAGGGIGITNASSLWRMDETSGNIADSDLTPIDGTAAGTPTYNQTGPWGSTGPSAIGFTKADAADCFTLGDFYDLADVNTTTWTLAGWVYWDGSGASAAPIMVKQAAGPNGWQLRVETSGRLHFFAFNAGVTVADIQTATGIIVANTWQHVVVVRSGSSLFIVVDLVTRATASLTGTIPNTAASLTFGTDGSNWYGGRLTQWAIWGSALNLAQVTTLVTLDKVDLPSPRSWREMRSITSVINHWLIGGVTTKKTASVNKYGRRTWDVDDTKEISGDVYSSELMDVMADPRPIVTATYSITDDDSPLITIAPLTLALYDGTLHQVLEVAHDISPDRWDVTLVLDRTQNDMTGAEPVLPV